MYPQQPPMRPQQPMRPPPPVSRQPEEEMPEWTKDGEFPPISRNVPLYGKDPASGEEQLWVGRVVWQAVTAKEIKMALYGPFGRRMSTAESVFSALWRIRNEIEDPELYDPPWKVLVKGARRDVWHVGYLVSIFPGDRAEVLVPGEKATESVDVLAMLDPDETSKWGGVVDQMKNSVDYFRHFEPDFGAGGSL
jgi:hypothetical protein